MTRAISPRTRLLVATTNRGKAREIVAAFRGLPYAIVTLEDMGIRDICPEDGTSFAENAILKSRFYSRRAGFLTLAEDSGLEVAALDGAPGVRSARFSGSGATAVKNNRKTLRLLRTCPWNKRRARFVCLLALARDGKILKVVRGIVRGTIAWEKRGDFGFGYDPIFYYHPLRKTFGQVPAAVKNTVSHRGRALAKMIAFLRTGAPPRRKGNRGPVPPPALPRPRPKR
jgi:XTP/dITP diphosphohydrolase